MTKYQIVKTTTIDNGTVTRRVSSTMVLNGRYPSLEAALAWAEHVARTDPQALPGQKLFHGKIWWTREIAADVHLEYRVEEWVEPDPDLFLDHVGVKGMKWGVRKPDTFFNVVKKHYVRSASGHLRHLVQDDEIVPMSRYSTQEEARRRAYQEASILVEDVTGDVRIVWDAELCQYQVIFNRYGNVIAFEYQKMTENVPAYPQEKIEMILDDFREEILAALKKAGLV